MLLFVQRALDAFFAQNPGYGESMQEYPTLNAAEDSLAAAQSMGSGEGSETKPHRVRVMSWNIDGLDTANLKQRTRAVINTIKAEKVEVALLQEVVADSESVLRESLTDYKIISGGTSSKEGYYTAILLHKQHTHLDDFETVPYFSSTMGRNLLVVNSSVKGVPMTLMTSHLESTKSHAGERKRQLGIGLNRMKDASTERTVLFGGDLNLRDKELESIGGLPEGIVDVWEETGSRKEARYTWDTYRNDNLATDGKWRTRLRFDRLYLRQCSPPAKLKPVYFELVGLQRVPDVNRFPSDHWGILAHFDILSGSGDSRPFGALSAKEAEESQAKSSSLRPENSKSSDAPASSGKKSGNPEAQPSEGPPPAKRPKD
ncbi:hypothetical protein V1264_010485 [Littorina saxatilis]|uniref:Tyrosyl-DNA phosphodiesterase 2 n=2 Tax=Littorina saxatilis TaxID=31220 RepID=A0AAN9G0T2_9CAEN